MLIEARVANYRSFKDAQSFSMVAAQGDEHKSTHTFSSGLPHFSALLKSAAIYGANSAGKTNLFRGLLFMKEFVTASANAIPNSPIPYFPYAFDESTAKAPSEFGVTFVEAGVRYEYSFAIDAKCVHSEKLIEYPEGKPRLLFSRELVKGKYEWGPVRGALRGNKSLWRESTKENSLFLSVAVQQNSKQLLPVYEWFQKRLVVVVAHAALNPTLTLRLLGSKEGKNRLLPFLQEADPGIKDLEVVRRVVPPGVAFVQSPGVILEQTPEGTLQATEIKFAHSAGFSKKKVLLNMMDESGGANALFQNAGAWLNVLDNGEILLFDEMDSSLHPLLARFLISQFNSKKSNPKNAQLVFTTHNAYLLSQDIFRRDQLWFVEKDFSGESKIYPLTDFSPRKGQEDIQRWYLRGKYGALPIIRHSDLN